jgi:hypothetical protein
MGRRRACAVTRFIGFAVAAQTRPWLVGVPICFAALFFSLAARRLPGCVAPARCVSARGRRSRATVFDAIVFSLPIERVEVIES